MWLSKFRFFGIAIILLLSVLAVGVYIFFNLLEKRNYDWLPKAEDLQIQLRTSDELIVGFRRGAESLSTMGIRVENLEYAAPLSTSRKGNVTAVFQTWRFDLKNQDISDLSLEQKEQIKKIFTRLETEVGAFVQMKIKNINWNEPKTVEIQYSWKMDSKGPSLERPK